MQASPFDWPAKDDYDMAMKAMSENIKDDEIRRGTIKEDNSGMLSYGGAGLYVALYHIDPWMVRCFCKTPQRKPPKDILERYRRISEFTQRMKHIPALVPITYVEQGIKVDYLDRDGGNLVLTDTKVLPFIKMPFIFGQSLGGFICINHRNRLLMSKLCDAWLQLIRDLERINMAHGDLDLTNVIVTQDRNAAITLKVIDYDNAWIPALAVGYEQTESGHEHFQHPAFSSKSTRPYNALMDRFSALVIYISLKALLHEPDLYAAWGADELHRLLLAKDDYKAEAKGTSNHITQLRDKKIPDLEPLLTELSGCLRERRMPCSLNELVSGKVSDRREIVRGNNGAPQKETEPGTITEDVVDDDYYDWGRLEDVSSAAPVPTPFVLPPVQTPRPAQLDIEPNAPVPNFGRAERGGRYNGMLPQHQYVPPVNRKAHAQRYDARAIIIMIIAIVLLLAIIVGILFATHVIHFGAASLHYTNDILLLSFMKTPIHHLWPSNYS